MFKRTFTSFIHLLGLSGIISVPLSAAIFHTIDTTSPLICTFSSKYQNRVMVEKGRIQKVIAVDEERLSIFMEELSGQAFISARDQNPEDTTISVLTETGQVQDLHVTFIDRLPEVVILTDSCLLDDQKDPGEDIQQKAAESYVFDKVSDILRGNIPTGYIPCQVKRSLLKPKKGIILETLAQLEGPDEILNLYQIINTTCKQKILNEVELQSPGCRWVFLETNTILPKQKVLGIIAVQK